MSEITFVRIGELPTVLAAADDEARPLRDCERTLFHLLCGLEQREMTFGYIFAEGQTLGWRLAPVIDRIAQDPLRLPDMPRTIYPMLFWLATNGLPGVGVHHKMVISDESNKHYIIVVCTIDGTDSLWNLEERSETIILTKVKMTL